MINKIRPHHIKLKRAYEPPAPDDGTRILIHSSPILRAWANTALIARVLVASGRPLPVQPLHLLGKQQPAARHFFECAFYGRLFVSAARFLASAALCRYSSDRDDM
jgi:hypothetical protein